MKKYLFLTMSVILAACGQAQQQSAEFGTQQAEQIKQMENKAASSVNAAQQRSIDNIKEAE